MVDLECTEASRNLCRDIYVSDGKEYHISEGIEIAETAGPILDDFDDAVEPFGDGVGEPRTDEREHAVVVSSQGVDELAQGLQSASKGRCHPLPDKAMGRPGRFVFPELLELILQLPGPVDASISLVERPQRLGVLLGAS